MSALGSHRTQVQDAQILDLMLWCKETLNDVLLNQTPLDQTLITQKLNDIHQLSEQDDLSDNLQLALKQISLLLETLPELVRLKTALLKLEIK